jgi:7-keto-8-aminopelargonate synthetase-like enzyme
MSITGRLARGLAALDRDGLTRSRRILDGPQGAKISSGGATLLNFSSNDYLGLANDARLREAAHHAIEEMGVGAAPRRSCPGIRAFMSKPSSASRVSPACPARPFASGYAANLGILATLGDRDAEIFSMS